MHDTTKWINIVFILLFFGVGGVNAEELFEVKWVNDGDTIVLSDGRTVRYIGIDAPEIDHENKKAEPFGYKAKQLNMDMVLSQPVRLEFDEEKFDRFGRLLAYVHLEDGTFVNGELVEHGLAYYLHKKPNIARGDELLDLQREAIRANRGIWAGMADLEEITYIGNKNSKRFHARHCEYGRKTGKTNKVLLHGAKDAFYEGFSPCRRCLKPLRKAGE